MKKILIVGGGTYQMPAIQMALDMGYYVIVSDKSAEVPGKKPANKFYQVSTRDHEGTLEIAKKENIDGLMTIVSESGIVNIARIANRLNLPGISVESAIAATHKGKMKKLMKEHDVPVAEGKEITGLEDTLSFCNEIDGPWVIKPTDSSGQRAVKVVNEISEIEEAIENAKVISTDGHALIEKIVEGPEINTTCGIINNEIRVLSVSNREILPPPHFGIAIRHVAPPWLSGQQIKEIQNVAAESTRALGIRTGVTYPQIIMTPEDGPKLIEIAARVPGGFMDQVAYYLSGVNMTRLVMLHAVNEPLNWDLVTTGNPYPSVIVKFITRLDVAPRVKKINQISGLDQARKIPGIKMCFMDLKPGDEVPELTSSWGRFGAVIAVGTNRENAIERANLAIQKIKIV